jgi:hypothetical protein
MVRLPLTPAEIERGRRLGALLRRARGARSLINTALDAGISPETLRKISLDTIWAEFPPPEAELGRPGHGSLEQLAS